MARTIRSTPHDYRLHQNFNSLQFSKDRLLTLREAADLGYIKLGVSIPGRNKPHYEQSLTSFQWTEKGESERVPIDWDAEIDPVGSGKMMSVAEAMEKGLIRPITASLMVGFAVV